MTTPTQKFNTGHQTVALSRKVIAALRPVADATGLSLNKLTEMALWVFLDVQTGLTPQDLLKSFLRVELKQIQPGKISRKGVK